MSEAEDAPATPGTAAGKRSERAARSQRANAVEPRTKRFVMLMNETDHARIKAVAVNRGLSMARLMQESALSESYDRRDRLVV